MKKNYQFSILNSQLVSGFTLIEMLVTIAIIAIISGVVIVGISPAKRIQDAQDAKAKQDVRATASAVEACLAYVNPTTQVTNSSNFNGNCGSALLLTTNAPGAPFARTVPGVTFYGGSATALCFYEQGSNNPANFWYYSTGVGQVQSQSTAPSTCP